MCGEVGNNQLMSAIKAINHFRLLFDRELGHLEDFLE